MRKREEIRNEINLLFSKISSFKVNDLGVFYFSKFKGKNLEEKAKGALINLLSEDENYKKKEFIIENFLSLFFEKIKWKKRSIFQS